MLIWITVLFFGSAFVSTIIGLLIELWSASKNDSDKLHFRTVFMMGGFSSPFVYGSGLILLCKFGFMDFTDAMGLSFGTLILLLCGIGPLCIFSSLLTRMFAYFTNRQYGLVFIFL